MTAVPRTILVTGAAGFVGRHLMPALAAAYPKAALVTPTIDVRNADEVDAAVLAAKPDVCIHLAAVSAVAAAQQAPDLAWQVNLHGSMHLAWALLRHVPHCQMLFVSSADAYGASFRAGVQLDERAPLLPMNNYGETKAVADLALGGMSAQGLQVVRLRPFNHTGPGQSSQFVVAAFAQQIARIAAGVQPPEIHVGNLDTWRDFLDVRDVCAAYVACIARRDELAPGTILNLASGRARRVGDVLADLAALANVEPDIKVDASRVRATDIRMACGDASRAHELLGWSPIIPWEQTLQEGGYWTTAGHKSRGIRLERWGPPGVRYRLSMSGLFGPLAKRVSDRVAYARSRFDADKRDQGTVAAICSLVRHYAIRSWRRIPRVADFVALLPLPNLFMRRDVLFIGYLEAGLGLGELLRSLVRSVAATGVPFALYPYQIGVETRLIGGFMEDCYDLKHRHRVNVIEMAADQVPTLFREIGRWKTTHSYNILRTYWELSQAPPEWAPMLNGIHEIWAPNEFVANAFRAIFNGPIILVPPCVEVATASDFNRAHFGMDQSLFWFVFSFDYFSHPARKNPIAVVQAFQAAFPDPAERVGLVIKSTNPTDLYLESRSALIDAAGSDQRIRLIDQTFSRDEMLSLIRESDCYISLHRSEGFGLGMAEAMAFGKPVIGTNYSGCTDFLSERTGFPVPFTLRPVHAGEYIWSAGQSWAEPDSAAAGEAMRRVFHDQSERQSRASAGREFVKTRYSRETIGEVAARRLRAVLAEQEPRRGG